MNKFYIEVSLMPLSIKPSFQDAKKIDGFKIVRYITSDTKPVDDLNGSLLYYEISENSYHLQHDYHIMIPDTNPETNKPWVGTEREDWISKQLQEKELLNKAGKGQLVENAIELNDAIKGYLDEKLKTIQQNINDKVGILLSPALTDQTLKQKHWNDLLSVKSQYQTILGYYKIALTFERSLGIAVSQDPNHPIHFFDEHTFIQILTEIKNLPPQNPLEIPQRPSLWSDITKMIGVEETYEPKELVDEWKKILNSIHGPAIDPNTAPGGSETLAGQLPTNAGGTQKPTK